MLKYLVIVIVLLVSAPASAQEVSALQSFVTFWNHIAEECAKQEGAFKAEVDITTQAIVSDEKEIRHHLFEAGKALRAGSIQEFITIMNRTESKIQSLRRTWGVSVKPELRAYQRLLSIAAGKYSGSDRMAATKSYVPDSL